MVVTDAKDTESFTAAGGEPGMLARDGGDRIYNRTKSKMTEVLENWQYFPIFVKPHPTAGWLYMPLEGFGYEQHQTSEFLNYESLLVLPEETKQQQQQQQQQPPPPPSPSTLVVRPAQVSASSLSRAEAHTQVKNYQRRLRNMIKDGMDEATIDATRALRQGLHRTLLRAARPLLRRRR